MRAQAQGLSSAANRDGSATRGSVFGRRDDATRAPSFRVDGSNAPSPRRGRLAALALTIAAFALLAFAPLAQADKIVVDVLGPDGTLGGQFGSPSNIAINQTGNGVAAGTIYVADANQHRIQRLDPNGDFELAWGWDVVTTGRPDDRGTSAFEVCTIAADCKAGLSTPASANGGQVNSPQGIDVDQSNGHVYVSDNNRRISEFDEDGIFVRAWGWDVISTGRPGDISTSAFEVCTVDVDCKTAAGNGTEGGRFFNNPRSLRLDSSNNVLVADTGNRRFQKFDATGNFIAVYGHNVNNGGALESCVSTAAGVCRAGTNGSGPGQFGSFSPFFFTFDSAGNILANNGNNDRIERFDPAFTTATTFATVPDISNNDPIITMPGDHVLFGATVGGEHQLHELDSGGTFVTAHLAGAGVTSLNGMTRDESSGAIYATTGTGSFNILKIDDPPGVQPEVTIDPITIFDASTATFSGTVDPRGNQQGLSCKFQYSTDQVTWTDVPAGDCAPLDPDGGSQAISEDATGLVPNTKYFVRLVVRRLFVTEAISTGLRTFDTFSVPPVVSNVGAIDVGDTSARMVGTIDPRNSDTGYVFEYGTTAVLGSSTEPVAIGAGTTPLIVSQVVTGLSPGVRYHFRLRATNAFGSNASVQQTLHTRADSLPPADIRAYEQVSPVDKAGGGAFVGTGLASSGVSGAYDGNGVGFCTTTLFGDPAPPFYGDKIICGNYVSLRGADGWHTKAARPPLCTNDLDSGSAGQNELLLSRSFRQAVFFQPESSGCATPLLDPAAPQPATNLYRENLAAEPSGYELLTPELPFVAPPAQPGINNSAGRFEGASADFSHVVYSSSGQQLGGGPGDGPAGSTLKLYEWDNGALRLVSVDTAGAPFATHSRLPGPIVGLGAEADHGGVVSTGGDRIFFANPTASDGTCGAADCELYMREGGTDTHRVSEQECDPACSDAGGADRFRYATPSGGHVLFTTTGRRTDEDTSASGDDLYLYAHSDNPATDQNLTLLSRDDEPADGTSAAVQGVLGASDDGDVIFFAANGQLVAGEPTPAGPKLYRWDFNGGAPTLSYLAGLNSGDSINWTSFVRQVAPSGKVLIVQTAIQLDPVGDQDADDDVYRWDEQRGWICVSCQLPGESSMGDSTFGGARLRQTSEERQINISDDGSRVFFDTYDPLVPEDVNGNVRDVYEWHDGRINLISPGTDTAGTPTDDPVLGVNFAGASHDGRDAFFISDRRLVGWDTDFANDIYDARIGGGFPEPPPTGVPCEGDACRGAGSSSPEIAGAGTRAFEAPVIRPKPNKTCGRFSKKAQRKLRVAKRAARRGQAKRTRKLRKQARNLNRRAKRCNRRQAS